MLYTPTQQEIAAEMPRVTQVVNPVSAGFTFETFADGERDMWGMGFCGSREDPRIEEDVKKSAAVLAASGKTFQSIRIEESGSITVFLA